MSEKEIPILEKGYTKEKNTDLTESYWWNLEFKNPKDDENPLHDIKKVVSLKILENYEDKKMK